MDTTTSSDGTTIAFDRLGHGPPVVLVGAGPTDHGANAPVAQLLADHFTVVNFDRRARGGSGDTQPFSVDREYDDLAAVIDAAGGAAMLYGTSGGAAIALEAAARGLAVTKLAAWEPPYFLDDEPRRPPADYHDRLAVAVAAGRPGEAVELFFAEYWPKVTDPDDEIARALNSLPKYVASTTLDGAAWQPTTVLTGDLAGEVAQLKVAPGRPILVVGSSGLAQTLMRHGLVDEYQLWLHPVVLGGGKRLFRDGGPPATLRLVDSRTTASGLVILTYQAQRDAGASAAAAASTP